jgi:hypothetical protein
MRNSMRAKINARGWEMQPAAATLQRRGRGAAGTHFRRPTNRFQSFLAAASVFIRIQDLPCLLEVAHQTFRVPPAE